MIKVAIIGAGKIADKHLEVLHAFDDVSIIVIVNRSEKRRQYLAEKYDIPHSYSDYKLMLKEVKVDAIFITVSLFSIKEVGLNCLEAGIPTFIEKPAGININDINDLLIASKKMKTINMIGLNRRFYSNISNALDIIKEDGGVRTIIIDCPQRLSDVNTWKGYEDKTNIWNGIHCIDLFRYFCADADYITSYAQNNNSDYNDTFNAFIRFKNGSVGHFISNWFSPGRWSITLIGNSKRIYICPLEGGYFLNQNSQEHELEIIEIDKKYKPGFFLQNRYFIDCVISNKQVNFPGSDLNDYYKTMLIASKINNGINYK
jgi:virulence factor